MKKIILLWASVLSSLSIWAQPGVNSIAFLGIQTDAPDAFAFVLLQDFANGDSIIFTDNGWSGTQFFTNENTMTWKANAAIPAGTVITITDPNDTQVANALLQGPGITWGKLFGLSTSGEQLFAYVYNGTTQVPIAAISTNAFLATCNASGVGNSNTSCLPSNLTLNVNAFQLSANAQAPGNPDNGFFNLPSAQGTLTDLQSIFGTFANWTISEDPLIAGTALWPNWQITIGAPDPSVVTFASMAASITEGANPVDITLNISPALNVPKTISIQIALNTDVTATDFYTVPAHTDGLILLTLPAGASTASFSIWAPAGDDVEGDEITTINLVSADAGVIIGAENLINLGIIEDLNQSFITFDAGQENVVLDEGESTEFTFTISPELATESTFNLYFTYGFGAGDADLVCNPALLAGYITVTVPSGETEVTVDIEAFDDLLVESTENFQISLSDFTGNLNPGLLTNVELNIIDNDIPSDLPPLFLNEIMATNQFTLTDEAGEYDDWIEIYNAGDTDYDLAGLYISNDANDPTKFQFTGDPNTLIPAGGFKIVWADDSTQQGILHTNFNLPSSGGFVGLYYLAGSETPFAYAVDTISYPALGTDLSYGRIMDGETPWVIFGLTSTSPQSTNNNGTVGITSVRPQIHAFPNPVTDYFRVQLQSDAPARIRVNTPEGRTVFEQNSSSSISEIPTASWAAGTYLVDVLQGDKRTVLKIQVLH